MRNRYASRQAEEAVIYGDGTRHCACCGDFIDPIDWCLNCQTKQAPCGTHRRLRKRADAAFCDSGCRAAYANSVKGLNRGITRRRQSAFRA
jgi:hypothetical protein